MRPQISAFGLPHPLLATVAVECAGLGIWQIDVASGAWHCSPRCREMLGTAEGDDPVQVLSSSDQSRFRQAIEQAVRDRTYRIELRVGTRRLSARGRVVQGSRGRPSIIGTLE